MGEPPSLLYMLAVSLAVIFLVVLMGDMKNYTPEENRQILFPNE